MHRGDPGTRHWHTGGWKDRGNPERTPAGPEDACAGETRNASEATPNDRAWGNLRFDRTETPKDSTGGATLKEDRRQAGDAGAGATLNRVGCGAKAGTGQPEPAEGDAEDRHTGQPATGEPAQPKDRRGGETRSPVA